MKQLESIENLSNHGIDFIKIIKKNAIRALITALKDLFEQAADSPSCHSCYQNTANSYTLSFSDFIGKLFSLHPDITIECLPQRNDNPPPPVLTSNTLLEHTRTINSAAYPPVYWAILRAGYDRLLCSVTLKSASMNS